MSPPRRVPFEGLTPPLTSFEDAFAYPLGPLTGQGRWIEDHQADAEHAIALAVLAAGTVGPPATYTGDGLWPSNGAPLPGFPITSPWTATLDFRRNGTNPESQANLDLAIGLNYQFGADGGGNVLDFNLMTNGEVADFYITSPAGDQGEAHAIPLTRNADHQLVITWDGAGHITASLDGTAIATATLTDTSNWQPGLSLASSAFDTTNTLTPTRIRLETLTP